MEFDWKQNLTDWIKSKQKIRSLSDELITFFELAFDNLSNIGFNNTNVRQKMWFGIHKNRASLVVGGNFFAACLINEANDDKPGMYLITDKKLTNLNYLKFSPVKNTENLSWLYAPNFEDVIKINNDSEIWGSYKRASSKIFQFKKVSSDRDSVQLQRGKKRVSEFWVKDNTNFINIESIETELTEKVKISLSSSKLEIEKRLKLAPIKPLKIQTTQTTFRRNPDVVAYVLKRANGIYEECKNSAPFRKKSDGTPYLEIHHKERLADGGDDTIENAIAVCPNCHRKLHFG